MGTVLAVAEQRDGEVKKATFEAIAEAGRLAGQLGGDVATALVGAGVEGAAAGLGAWGADKVYVVDHAELANYSTEGYTAAVCAVIEQVKPDVVLFPATALGKDLAPRVAARVGAGLASDVTALAVEDGKLVATRPIYAGKAIATVAFNSAVAMATLRPNVFSANAKDDAKQAEVAKVDATIEGIRAKVTSVEKSEGATIELTEAEIVVSGGRGIGGPEHFEVIEKLAASLGAAPGASRAIVDAGWVDHQHQVGQTGKTVSPNLYIAVGISGAIQHLAGMSSSKVIVAINKDAEAPIFKIADYGIVADLFQVVPTLTEELTRLRAEAS